MQQQPLIGKNIEIFFKDSLEDHPRGMLLKWEGNKCCKDKAKMTNEIVFSHPKIH